MISSHRKTVSSLVLLTTLGACSDTTAWEATLADEAFSGKLAVHLFVDDDLLLDGYESANPPRSERNVFVVELLTISSEPTLARIDFRDLAIGRCTPVQQTTDLVSTRPTVELHIDATVTCTDLRPDEELPLTLDVGL